MRPLSRIRIAHTRGRATHLASVRSFRLYKAINARKCARVDSNHHGEISPQGPQPCASTNSATGAEVASIAPEFEPSAARDGSPAIVFVGSPRYSANTCSLQAYRHQRELANGSDQAPAGDLR